MENIFLFFFSQKRKQISQKSLENFAKISRNGRSVKIFLDKSSSKRRPALPAIVTHYHGPLDGVGECHFLFRRKGTRSKFCKKNLENFSKTSRNKRSVREIDALFREIDAERGKIRDFFFCRKRNNFREKKSRNSVLGKTAKRHKGGPVFALPRAAPRRAARG